MSSFFLWPQMAENRHLDETTASAVVLTLNASATHRIATMRSGTGAAEIELTAAANGAISRLIPESGSVAMAISASAISVKTSVSEPDIWWSMDESSGVRSDSKGDYDIRPFGGSIIDSSAGKLSGAANLEIGEQLVRESEIPNHSTDWTWCGWVRLPISGNQSVRIFKLRDSSFGSIEFIFYGNAAISANRQVLIKTDSAGGVEEISAQNSFISEGSVPTWVFWTVSYDASEKNLKIYINGALEASEPFINSIEGSTWNYVAVGPTFDGVFLADEYARFPNVLNSSEVNWLYNGGAGRSSNSISTHLRSGSVIQIQSTNATLTTGSKLSASSIIETAAIATVASISYLESESSVLLGSAAGIRTGFQIASVSSVSLATSATITTGFQIASVSSVSLATNATITTGSQLESVSNQVGLGASITLISGSQLESVSIVVLESSASAMTRSKLEANSIVSLAISIVKLSAGANIESASIIQISSTAAVWFTFGDLWTAQDSAGIQQWQSIASSSSGSLLAAAAYNIPVKTSTDTGLNWLTRNIPPNLWFRIASSDNGFRLAVVDFENRIYTSDNSGLTWTARDIPRLWSAIASSSDGARLVAVVRNGQIYTSADIGVTWVSQSSGIRDWISVASSSDGKKLVAAERNGKIYTSDNFGVTWAEKDSVRNWNAVASSSDGANLVAAVSSGHIYISSDSGFTWDARMTDAARAWHSIASSASGKKLVASDHGGRLYISENSGQTWLAREDNRNWAGVACSADGLKLAAVVTGGKIYTLSSAGFHLASVSSVVLASPTSNISAGSKLASVSLAVALASPTANLRTGSQLAQGWFGSLDVALASPTANLRTGLQIASVSSVAVATSFSELFAGFQIASVGVVVVASSAANLVAPAGLASVSSVVVTSTAFFRTPLASVSTAVVVGTTSSGIRTGSKLASVSLAVVLASPTASIRTGLQIGSVSGVVVGTSTSELRTGLQLASVSTSIVISKTEAAGETWTARDSNRTWRAAASSSDGAKLVAAAYNGQLYTSTNSGDSWTPRDSNRNWYGLASSSDGTKLVAVVNGGQIYTSTDSGVLWTARSPALAPWEVSHNRNWSSVASSSNGTKLVAVASYGRIYTSEDSGVSWSADMWSGNGTLRNWAGVASSSDGTKLVAVVNGSDTGGQGYIFTSINSGHSWAVKDAIRYWINVASSSDGTKLVATVFGGQLYTSTNSGDSWTPRDSNRNWGAVASSSDGQNLVAGSSGQLYTSNDYGVSWTARDSDRLWYGLASSSDGTKLFAAAYGGQLYTSRPAAFASLRSGNGLQLASVSTSILVGVSTAILGNQRSILRVTSTSTSLISYSELSVRFRPRDTNRLWSAICTSSDGSKKAALVRGGSLYTSVSGGANWLARAGGDTYWGIYQNGTLVGATIGIASSSDGTRLITAVQGGKVWISTNSGESWTPQNQIWIANPFGGGAYAIAGWKCVASSASGQSLAAAATNLSSGGGGQIYISGDGGLSWRASIGAMWSALAMTSDGVGIIGVESFGNMLSSNNGGMTWQTSRLAWPYDGGARIKDVAISSNGQIMAVVTEVVQSGSYGTDITGGHIHTSHNGGYSWVLRTIPNSFGGQNRRRWTSIAISANGARMVATSTGVDAIISYGSAWIGGGAVYRSEDYGVNWTRDEEVRDWIDVALSENGRDVAAAAYGGMIYTIGGDPSFLARSSAYSEITLNSATTLSTRTNWTPLESNRLWNSLACDQFGQKLIAAEQNGMLYYTANRGANWVARTSAGVRGWHGLAMSANGQKILAAVHGGALWHSSDYGITWLPSGPNVNLFNGTLIIGSGLSYYDVASSHTGQFLVAVLHPGFIYTSVNYGANWVERMSYTVAYPVGPYTPVYTHLPARHWRKVACSQYGQIIFAVAYGNIWRSADWGQTWAIHMSDINRNWFGLALSADGTRAIACEHGGYVWTWQLNAVGPIATFWNRIDALGYGTWLSVSSSHSGRKLLAVGQGRIYFSTDYGATWRAREEGRNWQATASSWDGTKLSAVALGDRVYISPGEAGLAGEHFDTDEFFNYQP